MTVLKITHKANQTRGNQYPAGDYRFAAVPFGITRVHCAMRAESIAGTAQANANQCGKKVEYGLRAAIACNSQHGADKQKRARAEQDQRHIGFVRHIMAPVQICPHLHRHILIFSKVFLIRLFRFLSDYRSGVADGGIAPPVRVLFQQSLCALSLRTCFGGVKRRISRAALAFAGADRQHAQLKGVALTRRGFVSAVSSYGSL